MIETISQVNRVVSKDLGIDEGLVKSVNAFYWKKVREAISSADHTSMRINSLGTYVISRRKLWTYIRSVIKEIRYFRNSTKEFKRKSKEEYIEDRLGELRILLRRRNDLAIVYKCNEDKYHLKLSKNAKGDVEE